MRERERERERDEARIHCVYELVYLSELVQYIRGCGQGWGLELR